MNGAIDMARAAWPEVAEAVERGVMAILAIGAVEQHGPHLPLTTDADLAHGVARRIADKLGTLLLPAIAYGDAWSNEAFAGTLSVSPETLRAMIEDIGRGLIRLGVEGLVTVNGHFGNREPVALAARSLVDLGLPVLNLDYPKLTSLAAEICDSDPAGPGFYHADEVETSMMLAVRPEAVDMSKAQAEYPIFPETFGHEPMQLREFNTTGVFGDPRPATAEKGEMLIAGIADASLGIIEAFRLRHAL